MLIVEQPGLLTTVQDLGRQGFYRLGIPPSGAADRRAHGVANWLVGNDAKDATLESAWTGPALRVEDQPIVIASCGAASSLTINGDEVEQWTAYFVEPGDQISCGPVTAGVRSYLAVSGGLRVALRLNSRATYQMGKLGGLDGRQLKAGDQLNTGTATSAVREGFSVPEHMRPPVEGQSWTVGMVPGLFNYRLTPDSGEAVFSQPWTIKDESDRVAYRLDGPALRFVERKQPVGAGDDPSNVVDAGYPVGCLMVPAGEEGILNLWDGVTAGGFATVGTVVRCELDRLAQARPGDAVSFAIVDLEGARRLRQRYSAELAELRAVLATPEHGARSSSTKVGYTCR